MKKNDARTEKNTKKKIKKKSRVVCLIKNGRNKYVYARTSRRQSHKNKRDGKSIETKMTCFEREQYAVNVRAVFLFNFIHWHFVWVDNFIKLEFWLWVQHRCPSFTIGYMVCVCVCVCVEYFFLFQLWLFLRSNQIGMS